MAGGGAHAWEGGARACVGQAGVARMAGGLRGVYDWAGGWVARRRPIGAVEMGDVVGWDAERAWCGACRRAGWLGGWIQESRLDARRRVRRVLGRQVRQLHSTV